MEAVANGDGELNSLKYEVFNSPWVTTINKINRLGWIGSMSRMADNMQNNDCVYKKDERKRAK